LYFVDVFHANIYQCLSLGWWLGVGRASNY